jgi:hypothetical protein
MLPALLALSVLAGSTLASAADKPRKPSVCASFELVSTAKGRQAVCYDGKRPKLMSSFAVVDVTDPDSGSGVRVLVGF